MRYRHIVHALAMLSTCSSEVAAEQLLRAGSADDLVAKRVAVSAPLRRLQASEIADRSVRTGDEATQGLRDIALASFAEQREFAERMNKADLINANAIVALPEVEDEVLEFDDAFVVRRATKVIVRDPKRVARESELFRTYLAAPAREARLRASALSSEERAGLQAFMQSGLAALHPQDPLRDAAAAGEDAVLDAIIAGKGTLVIEDTLIVPKAAGVDPGGHVVIPTIRNGVLDLARPEPVRLLPLRAVLPDSEPPDLKLPAVQSIPAKPSVPPSRASQKPTAKASGTHTLTAEFLLGMTRASNFQWERKWTFPSGYFRLTVGAGYAVGYRIPLLATARVGPTTGYIRDYADKKVTIGAAATVKTLDAPADFYKRAGLAGEHAQAGRELLLEANVGWGYKFRALWKDILHRPYTAIGVSYSQNFAPPTDGLEARREVAMLLEPATTKIRVEGKFVGGSATIRLAGAAMGTARINLDTLVDNKRQKTFAITPDKMLAAGTYPYQLTLDPRPLRQGATTQTRPFGVRLRQPTYRGRLIIQPAVRFGFRVGYRRLKREFRSGWIPFNQLRIDTGNVTWPVHAGTRKQASWNEGQKTFVKLDKPTDRTGLTTAPRLVKPSQIQLPDP